MATCPSVPWILAIILKLRKQTSNLVKGKNKAVVFWVEIYILVVAKGVIYAP